MFEKVCIATFSVYKDGKRTAINGMVEPLLSFFQTRTKELDLIDGPHPGSDTVLTMYEKYLNGNVAQRSTSYLSSFLSPLLRAQNENGTQVFFKLRDIVSVFEWMIRSRKRYDLFIGLESIFTIAGIMLKKIGLAKKVVYYVSDYSPKRYPQKMLNSFYLWLDRYCCYNADYIWDVSPAMLPARISAGLDKKKSHPFILVPNALFPEQINYLPDEKVKKNSLVFAGTFGFENGSKLAIETMVEVVKNISDASLHFFGGDEQLENQLKTVTRDLNLQKHVFFHGFIPNAPKLSESIKRYMIGLAPYLSIPGSARWYADATKIRLYLGAGLPVITTQVPPLGREISRIGAAIIVNDDERDLAKAIIDLLNDKKKYTEMRKNAKQYAKKNTWGNTFRSAFSQMNLS